MERCGVNGGLPCRNIDLDQNDLNLFSHAGTSHVDLLSKIAGSDVSCIEIVQLSLIDAGTVHEQAIQRV